MSLLNKIQENCQIKRKCTGYKIVCDGVTINEFKTAKGMDLYINANHGRSLLRDFAEKANMTSKEKIGFWNQQFDREKRGAGIKIERV